MFIKAWIVICLDIFLIKILSDVETKNMFTFALGLSFMFGTYVGHCILSFLLQEKKQKIVAEIDSILKKYECECQSISTDFREFIYSEKPKKKKEI